MLNQAIATQLYLFLWKEEAKDGKRAYRRDTRGQGSLPGGSVIQYEDFKTPLEISG